MDANEVLNALSRLEAQVDQLDHGRWNDNNWRTYSEALAIIRAALASAPRAAEARVVENAKWLMKRALNQLSAWQAKYGAWQPYWLPPAGDTRLAEDIDDFLAAHPAQAAAADAPPVPPGAWANLCAEVEFIRSGLTGPGSTNRLEWTLLRGLLGRVIEALSAAPSPPDPEQQNEVKPT